MKMKAEKDTLQARTKRNKETNESISRAATRAGLTTIGQTPVASALDLAIANKLIDTPSEPASKQPRKKYKTLTRTAKGTVETLPKPKAGLYRTKGEGRAVNVMPTRCRKVKLKSEYWNSEQIGRFFNQIQYIAEKKEQGWFIGMNEPNRKLCQADQIQLLIQNCKDGHLVHYNFEHKHFIIESLAGDE